MKTKNLLLLTILCATMPLTSKAAIAMNDSLLIDFSKTESTTGPTDDPNGTWNNVTGPNLGFSASVDPIPSAANLVRYSDGLSTGVSLGLIIPETSQVNIGSITIPTDLGASFAATGAIPSSAQSDVAIGAKILDSHSPTPVTFRFNGLDDGLFYNLEFQAWIGTDERDPKNFVVQQGLANEASLLVDPNISPSVYGFTNIATNGAGQITLTLMELEKGPDTAVINAMALTAIPEPGFYASACGLVVFLLIVVRRQPFRRKCKSQN